MPNPKLGLHYKDVHHKLKHYTTTKTWNTPMRDSMINQVRLAEGEGAAVELNKEFVGKDTNNHSSNKVAFSQRYSANYDRIFKKGSEITSNSDGSERT